MASLESSVLSLARKLPATGLDPSAAIPWEGVKLVSRYFAGNGQLMDWLAAEALELDREWAEKLTEARVANAILLHIEQDLIRYLPSGASEWLDLIDMDVRRLVEHTEFPSAHTDWAATASTYGRYPSPQFIDRRSTITGDTALTRTLRWMCEAAGRADTLVRHRLGFSALTPSGRFRLLGPLNLPELAGATEVDLVDLEDIEVADSYGHRWRVVARIARLLRTIWHPGPLFDEFSLSAITPQFEHQLFEIGCLGIVLRAAIETAPGSWVTKNPAGAARNSLPCFSLDEGQNSVEVRYQTVPKHFRSGHSPYYTLTREFGGGRLRPDVWLSSSSASSVRELVLEVKYSADVSYALSGVADCMAYSVEFERLDLATPTFVSVCPTCIVDHTVQHENYILTNPDELGAVISSYLSSL